MVAHIDVDISSSGRHRRTVDIKDHPESYDLEFLIERSKVHLHLVQNNEINTNVQTFVLKDGFLIQDDLGDDEFGSFIRNGEGYFLQTADTNGSINNKEMHKFEIIKQNIKPLLFDDGEMTGGLAYVGAICGESSQSIIEDDFDYSIIITTSHELGHSLSSQHDSKGNNCHESDGYVMAAVSTVHLGTTATHPWIFSNCSTNYFTSKLDSLDSQNMNCMKTLGPSIDPTVLAKYDKLYGGQAFDADAQCKHTHGNSSNICKGLFKGNYTTICNQMYCSLPTDLSKCRATKAWDRTVCGNKKWCVYGVCTNDVNAPVSNAGQLYDPDTQCRHIHGNSSGLCREVYKGNFTTICGKLYCTDPANPTSCKAEIAEEGTQCGNKKWCVDGACTFDTKAPAGIDNCLFGDKSGSVFSNGWSCADMMRIASNNCPVVPIKCCASCAPPTTTTSSSTSQSTTTITTPTTTTIHTTTTTPSTIIKHTTTTIPTTTELSTTTLTPTTTTIPTTAELSTTTLTPTTTTIPTTTELSTTTPTPSTTKIQTTIPTTTKIPTILTTTTMSSTTLTTTTTKTPTTNTPSTTSKTTKTKVATPTTNYSTLKINTNTTRNLENYSQHGKNISVSVILLNFKGL
ncbi:Hypothetical predicted protein [Mytilus galloprovincialis]|uniref:Peptidase M12B domain-containing protein n=1 Tax=Mytilus galloprovincialis TaxID=29158 RepID=A0A8B6GPB3_MYTGA|nr:Hypothetical predicted protein [Mytilus galloprovincialis]